jgi:hypothetical protein
VTTEASALGHLLAREPDQDAGGMELRTGDANHRHEKIVRALAIAHNVNNFHQATSASVRVPRTIAAAMPRAALGVAAGGAIAIRRRISGEGRARSRAEASLLGLPAIFPWSSQGRFLGRWTSENLV